LWRLYPKRSITSHRFCGSGRLFPGLRSETRRAKSGMIGLVATDDASNSERRQAYLGIIPLSREYCRKGTKRASFCKSHRHVSSKQVRILRNRQVFDPRRRPIALVGASLRGKAARAGQRVSGSAGQRVRRQGGRAVTARERRRYECVTNWRRRASSGVVRAFFERVQLQNYAGEVRCPRSGFSKRARGGDPRPSRARERS
jgi:hypothetical protein